MVDTLDKTQEDMDLLLDMTLKSRQRFDKESAEYCEDCDAEIPPQRRRMGGVTRCVHCQEVLEEYRRTHRK